MTDMEGEPITVGLSKGAKVKLDRLKQDGHFDDMMDGYKFAIGLALANGAISPPLVDKTTYINVGSLDRDRSLYEVVKTLRDETDEAVYKTAERLAEWGVNELSAQAESGSIDFSSMLNSISAIK